MKKLLFLLLFIPYSLFSQINITNIHPYQVFQRNDTGNADILIQGIYSGSPVTIEARWNNSTIWTPLNIDNSTTFSGTLLDQSQGQGTLEVRFSNDFLIEDSIEYVGVGDIFIIAGQSNASGRGLTLNSYSHPSLKAALFGNDDVWKELADGVDDKLGQVDLVSFDFYTKGSPWPLIATNIMESQNVPVAFIPTAKGGTRIYQWEPEDNHSDPSTLYGSMNRRINAVGGNVKGVLFFQGESDAQMDTTQSDYEHLMNIFVNTVASDFPGLTVMIGQIGHADFDTLDDIRSAQINVIHSNSNAYIGPATYDINLSDEDGDTLHFKSDNDVQEFARRWFLAINNIYYNGTNGFGPIVDTVNVSYNIPSNKVIVPFTDDTTPVINTASTITTASFDLYNNGPISLSSVTIIDNTIEIIPTSSLDIDQPITLTYASLNKGVDAAIYDNQNLPAQNFYDIKVSLNTLATSSFLKDNFSVFPNPVHEELFISFKNAPMKEVTLEVYSTIGQFILSTTSDVQNNNTLRLNTAALPSGMYYIHVITEGAQETKKVIKA
jgi:hypothetical protein